MFYRFNCGTFIKADTFEQAKEKFIQKIMDEKEDADSWHRCTCLGISHRYDCPEMEGEIPF